MASNHAERTAGETNDERTAELLAGEKTGHGRDAASVAYERTAY